MHHPKGFPSRLVRLRADAGMTQKDLSKASGVSVPQIGRYEMGASAPRMTALVKLAKALGVSVEDLVSGSEDPETTVITLQSDSGPDLPFSVRTSDVERMRTLASALGVSVNAVFLASLDIATAATKGKELSLDDALRDAELFLKESE